ncbi:MAG: type II toxin-antitoxin system VapB family antitoxin [Melioribacteraceae bacterium]|nr:type II toxin-antitoxin system VapB family antitoxin [Melioribacteraceae bacterium]
MATNLAIDDDLIKEAVKLSDFKTKKAAVTEALEEYVNRKKQLKLKEVFNTIVYEKSYDYKKQRNVK